MPFPNVVHDIATIKRLYSYFESLVMICSTWDNSKRHGIGFTSTPTLQQ